MNVLCSACGAVSELPEKVGFRDVCPSCDSWLHACVNCRFRVQSGCGETAAEKVRDPEGQNFCEWYRGIDANSAGEGKTSSSKDAAEELWKKLTKK
ncbi:MAG: hypothetical protein RRA32_04495 [bacterium]|nr:hypothetical protein [bacterium]